MNRTLRTALAAGLAVIVVAGAFLAGRFSGEDAENRPAEEVEVTQPAGERAGVETEKMPSPDETAELDRLALQVALDNLGQKYDQQFGLVVYDLSGDYELAAWNGDARFYTASLYKLYLNFLAYQDLEGGVLDPSLEFRHPSLGELQLRTCLVLMVQLSDSPCAESVRGLYSEAELQRRVDRLGLTDYSVAGFTTSPRDMAGLLRLVWRGEQLTPENRERILSAMENHIYADNLPAALGELGTTYNAIGYKQDETWNDVAIIELRRPERVIAVALLTNEIFGEEMTEITAALRQALEGDYPPGGQSPVSEPQGNPASPTSP